MKRILFAGLFFLSYHLILAQSKDLIKYQSDSLGSYYNLRKSVISGNSIRTVVNNSGQIGELTTDIPQPYPSLKWPVDNGYDYLQGFSFIIGSRIYLPDKARTITPVETWFNWFSDPMTDKPQLVPQSLATETWGFNPVAGYSALNHPGSPVARRSDPSSWPAVWPKALGLPDSMNGSWHTGLYSFSAIPDEEVFFVCDDSKDAEFTIPSHGFYPFQKNSPDTPMDVYEGTVIATIDSVQFPGGFKPDEARQWYNPAIRKGLGLRIEGRYYQWNDSVLTDILFGSFDIFNLSERDYTETAAGFYLIPLGFTNSDTQEMKGGFIDSIQAAVFYDIDGKASGNPDIQIGILGFIFLSTPGSDSNGLDDDKDGLTDESQSDGLDNDMDWDAPVDDLGTDGLANTGDPGEGNGIPDSGEPNFEWTDPDELDGNGFRSMVQERIDGKTSQDLWPFNDDRIWDAMNQPVVDSVVAIESIQSVVSGGIFNFPAGNKSRIDCALILAWNFDELIRKIHTAREFYSSGYRNDSRFVSVSDRIQTGELQLFPAYPNPFNPYTTIRYNLPVSGLITLDVFNSLGQKVRTLENGFKPAGNYTISFNASGLSSGIYFYRLTTGTYSQARKMVVLK